MCPTAATNKPVIIFTGFWRYETDFWCVKSCSKYLLDFWLFKIKLWWFVKINSNLWVACVFILPGKAVRRVNRTVPANISTNRSSVASPERAGGEANGYRSKRNPVKSITPQSVFIQLTWLHRVQRDTCSPGSDGGGDSWDGRMWEETEAGGRGSLFFSQVSCNVQLHLEHIFFPVFMVCDDNCLNDCDLSLYCICFNCCELPVFLFWRSSWPVSCPDLPLLHVWLVWLNISWVYLFCSAGLYFIHDL